MYENTQHGGGGRVSIYDTFSAMGVPMGSRYSDLHVPSTPDTRGVLLRYPQHKFTARGFTRSDGEIWIEIPFAYDPYWSQHNK